MATIGAEISIFKLKTLISIEYIIKVENWPYVLIFEAATNGSCRSRRDRDNTNEHSAAWVGII